MQSGVSPDQPNVPGCGRSDGPSPGIEPLDSQEDVDREEDDDVNREELVNDVASGVLRHGGRMLVVKEGAIHI